MHRLAEALNECNREAIIIQEKAEFHRDGSRAMLGQFRLENGKKLILFAQRKI